MKNIQNKYKLNFKTMKKGLLTLLAASLVFVGCQNYDDQFDDLNAQISALKSQVDGLASLSGQVASLSGTISGLQAGISAAQASASSAASSASAAAAQADANADAIAAATAAATAAGASADANADAIAAATAAATAAGASADAATAAAQAATDAATAAGTSASTNATDLDALSASLTSLAADVAAVQAAIATASTSAEVAALQDEIDAIKLDLDSLLTSNNVYATGITINSAASMASALALGNKVALMNADVNITDDATIADADIQTFIDRIKTMNGTFRYDSGSATGYAPTFDEMVSATVIDVESAGPISFKKLASATTVTFPTTYTTKITALEMPLLASVTTFSSGTDGSETANNLTLASATNIDLGALTMYNVANSADALTISMKKGGVLDIASLEGKERTTDLEEPLSLTISGPASLNISKIADGTLTVSNVASLTVSGFYGTLDVNQGVETLTTTDTVLATLDGAVDVVTATLDFAYDWDPDLTTAQKAVADDLRNTSYLSDIAATGDWVATDLKTLTVTGELLDLYLDEANLETLTIDATMHDLTLSGTTDLTSLTIAEGSKIGNIKVTGANNLAVADFNHTTNLNNKLTGSTAGTSANSANKAVSFEVYDNTALTTLHSTGDDVSTFTVAGNDALTSVDFTGLKDQGTATAATVRLWDNDLTAVQANNTTDGETDKNPGLATDLGSFDAGTSGMKTLYTYLSNIDDDADNTVFVTFDTVSTEVDTETSGSSTTTLNITGATGYTNGAGDTTETPTSTNKATVLAMTPATPNDAAGEKDAIAARKGFYGVANAVVQFRTASGGNIPATPYTLTGDEALDAALIASTANKDLFSAVGVTLDAYAKGHSYQTVSLINLGSTDTAVVGQRYTTTADVTAATTDTNGSDGLPVFSTSLSDTFTLSVGGTTNSVTVSLGGQSQTTTTLAAIEDAIRSGWAAKYGKGGTASSSAIATILSASDGKIYIRMLQEDSGGHGKAVAFSVSNASSASSRTTANIDYVIGATKNTNDDSTVATTNASGLIITLTSNDKGTDLNKVSGIFDASTGASLGAYSTDFTTNTAYNVYTYAHTTVERTDVRSAEDSVAAATSTAVAAVLFTRVAWLA